MLRVESDTGWWLITHPDHAHLAAAFAAHWGNAVFASPRPRNTVLRAVHCHDDGWSARDAHPCITKEGKPSAFSQELVGKYSAFEEIDLRDYLTVRESALARMERECAYAALLISMHTQNLLSVHADRSALSPGQSILLDAFLQRQRQKQETLRTELRREHHFADTEVDDVSITNNFRLLQATDNLSLYSCVNYMETGDLLHPLPTTTGGFERVEVFPVGTRCFRLNPYPFDDPVLTFTIPARHVVGRQFVHSEALEASYHSAPIQELKITLCA